MKYASLVLISALWMRVSAQTDKHHSLKINLLSPIYNTLNVSYERVLSPTRSVNIIASYTSFNDFYDKLSDTHPPNSVKGFSVAAEYRLYITDPAPVGLYGAPFLRYLNYERDYDGGGNTDKSKYQSGGIGMIIGYQFVLKNVITFDFFGGPVYQLMLSEERNARDRNGLPETPSDEYLSSDIPNRYLSGYGMRAGITLGMRF